MEVTTVSPPPASPTEGDDLCEIDVTSVAIHSVTLLIGLCGLAGNGAVLRLIVMNDITSFIFNLAFADFLFLLFMVPSALLFLLEDVSCSQIMSLMYLGFLFHVSVLSYYWGLYGLWRSGLIQDMYDLCELCFGCCLSERLWWLVDSAQFWAFFALFTVNPTVTSWCPSHEQGHCRAALISVYTIILLLCAAPIVISRTLNFIKAKRGSQQQQLKRRDIVVFLVVLFTLLLSLWNFLQQLGYIVVPSHVVFLLTCINSSIKPFIYFLAGRCWRGPCSLVSLQLSLQGVLDEPEENAARSNDATRDTVV